MSGADKGSDGDKTRQADWIDDEGEMQGSVPLPPPLGAYRSPLDEAAPEAAAAPTSPPFDPEGPGRLGDASLAGVLSEIKLTVQAEVDLIKDELRVHLGKKIDKSSAEVVEQIAAHTAALNRLIADSGAEARAKELRAFAEKSTEDIERRLEMLAVRLDGTTRTSNEVSRELGSQIKHTKEVQQRAKVMQDQALELHRTDWRIMAIGVAD